MADSNLQASNSFRCLSVTFSSDIKWNDYIDSFPWSILRYFLKCNVLDKIDSGEKKNPKNLLILFKYAINASNIAAKSCLGFLIYI